MPGASIDDDAHPLLGQRLRDGEMSRQQEKCMTSDSIVNVTEAKARLHKLVMKDSFAISRHGKIVGIYLSKDRIEALVETMELMSKPDFSKALKDYESGRMKFHSMADLDKRLCWN
jgi:PHD/YefM family antitoxin component YafN of YafNO toxin-antitoxin module